MGDQDRSLYLGTVGEYGVESDRADEASLGVACHEVLAVDAEHRRRRSRILGAHCHPWQPLSAPAPG